MVKMWSRVVALVLAALLPASLLSAEVRGAMLYATNSVIVNGSEINRSSAIFVGDKLSVPNGSTATITLKGTSIMVPKLTSITFNGDSIALDPDAAVAVTTTSGMAAQVANIHIAPANGRATQYQVARFYGRIAVAVKTGSVSLTDATGTHFIAEGKAMEVADPEPQKPGSIPTATTGLGAGGLSTAMSIAVGLAAVLAASLAAELTTGTPTSPAKP